MKIDLQELGDEIREAWHSGKRTFTYNGKKLKLARITRRGKWILITSPDGPVGQIELTKYGNSKVVS